MTFSHWAGNIGTKETNHVLKELALCHLRRVSAETTRECLIASLTSDRFLDLCDYNCDYTQLSCGDALNIRQAQAFFGKREDLDVGINPGLVCVKTFIETEAACRQTNDIFQMYAEGDFFFLPHVERVLHTARRKIASILGECPTLDQLKLRFGPGATTQVKKREASWKRKLSVPFACSADASQSVSDVLSEVPHWASLLGTESDCGEKTVNTVEVHTGVLQLVPKSYKTKRAIVIEPTLNVFVQGGIGEYMANRLRIEGVDIRDQTRNQRLAREGSLTGELATLDLSSASDLIAKGLVLDLLPIDWVVLLSTWRTSNVNCFGVSRVMEKFSSMGNGYTFPLETLVFYSLLYAVCCEDRVPFENMAVYGDDIIVPVTHYDRLCEVLETVGFIPNRKKSFASGPFRESCGTDYFSGIDIRPCFIKGPLSVESLYVLHNFYVRHLDEEMAELVRSIVPVEFHNYGPDGYGDGHLIGRSNPETFNRDRGWGGYVFETYTRKPKRDFQILPGDRIYPLYSTYAKRGESTMDLREPAYRKDDYRHFLRKHSCSPADVERIKAIRPRDYLRAIALASASATEECFTPFKGETPGASLPGAETYNKMKIYTLSPLI